MSSPILWKHSHFCTERFRFLLSINTAPPELTNTRLVYLPILQQPASRILPSPAMNQSPGMSPNPNININIPGPGNELVCAAFRKEVAADLRMKAAIASAVQSHATPTPTPTTVPNEVYQRLDFTFGGFLRACQYRVQSFPPTEQYGSAKWKVYGKPRIIGVPESLIGYVEIDALVYADQERVQTGLATGQLVLELMATAVEGNCFVRVGVEVHMVLNERHVVVGYVEYMLARAFSPESTSTAQGHNNVLQEFRRRLIAPRMCSLGCGALIPWRGPDHCLWHVLTPP
ncbi:hypothetical protein B0H16DRAFT_1536262 [Mycena metata]|uniref:Uncharacterized protein n=1 Tax=Mycena metata TaxID=1033252 RepID=A0AAD7J7Q5_9AGAR|nr:hypothetical protein B0H16DRAFT_1536262 [Mycena metata]